MVLLQCVNAYMAVQTMMERETDYQTAYALVTLKKELSNSVAFYQKEEQQLMEAYAARDEEGKIVRKEGGRFALRDPDAAKEYSAKREKLNMVEVKLSISPIRVPVPERIQPAILEALDGFLIFGEDTP